MKKSFWLLGDDFTIKDESGQDCFVLRAKQWTLKTHFTVENFAGIELATVRQLPWDGGLPAYAIEVGGRLAATLRRDFFAFHPLYELDDPATPAKVDMVFDGDPAGLEYTLTRGDRVVASVNRTWFPFVATYGVEVEDSEDPIFVLACTAVADLIYGRQDD